MRRVFYWLNKRSRKSNHGFVAVEALLSITMLMIPTALFVSAFPQWSEYQQFATVVAHDVARNTATSGNADSALTVAKEVANNYNIQANKVDVRVVPSVNDTPDPSSEAVVVYIVTSPDATQVTRPGNVTVVVKVKAPGVAIPMTDVAWKFISVSETHTEVVEPYRSFDAAP